MRWNGMPMAMWAVFAKSFRTQLTAALGYDADTAREITRKARSRYKEIIAKLPEFEKGDRFQMNIIGCAMLGAFILSMPRRPDVESLTAYYENAQMTPLMKWFCRQSGKSKFTPKDISRMKATAARKAADRNPYSWNMDFYEYPDGSGYEGRFTKCGICTLMKELGLYDLTPAMCHLDYSMSEAGGVTDFVRQYTLASGGPYCDCGYQKKRVRGGRTLKYFEFGQEHPELMVMLHGGGVCYRGALPVAEEMAKTYHVVLVAYDGFNPDEPETEFKSVPDEARRLGDYIVEHYGGKIDILYGVSYGTFILMDVLADDRLSITTTIADGMPTMDYADIKSPVLQNIYIFFLTGFSYWLIGKAGPIRKKLVCKMMGRTEESFDRIVYKDATWQSWVNQDKCMIGRHRNFDLFKRTDMYIWHGIASSTEKKLAKHIKVWQDKGYAFTYKVFTNMGHGTLAGEHPEQFSKEVQAAHRQSLQKEKP